MVNAGDFEIYMASILYLKGFIFLERFYISILDSFYNSKSLHLKIKTA